MCDVTHVDSARARRVTTLDRHHSQPEALFVLLVVERAHELDDARARVDVELVGSGVVVGEEVVGQLLPLERVRLHLHDSEEERQELNPVHDVTI